MLVNVSVELASMLVTIQRLQTEFYIKGTQSVPNEFKAIVAKELLSASESLNKVLAMVRNIEPETEDK